MPKMADMQAQVITGVVSPEQGEALIRQTFPSVTTVPAIASLGRVVMGTPLLRVLSPLVWPLLLLVYVKKVLPGLGTRYTLTNRRLMIQRGLRPSPAQSVPLADIDDVRLREDANSAFYRAATLEILHQGKVVLELPGVPEADSFRLAILNACKAWVPGRTSREQICPASAMKKA